MIQYRPQAHKEDTLTTDRGPDDVTGIEPRLLLSVPHTGTQNERVDTSRSRSNPSNSKSHTCWLSNKTLLFVIFLIFGVVVAGIVIYTYTLSNAETPKSAQAKTTTVTDHCSLNSSLCLNGGSCRSTESNNELFTCYCRQGYEGKNCETKTDDCTAIGVDRCLNGGTCLSGSNGFSCVCPSGYTGPLCDSDRNECLLNRTVCMDHGRCENTKGSFACHCYGGYAGRNCETNIDDCALGTECINGGTCVDQVGGYQCNCPQGFTGKNCGTVLACKMTTRGQTVSTASLDVIKLDTCGGLIQMPNFPIKSSFVLDYNSNKTYQRDENCLWQFESLVAGKFYRLKVKVTLLCEGFVESGGALRVFNWKFDGNIEMALYSQELRSSTSSSQIYETTGTYPDYKLFLSYSSTNSAGSGFLALVNIVNTELWYSYTGSNFLFTTSPGNETYGPFKHHDLFSLAVNPRQNTTIFTVNYLDSPKTGFCSGSHDLLDIYELRSKTGANRLARLCGNITSPLNYTSEFPILATFRTHETVTGTGFMLSWE